MVHEIDGYRLERRLGAGGFATVWLAFDERLDGHVAIKVLADNWTGDPDVTRRFLEEARFMWRADDPRIVRVHTVGEMANGQPYFVMEFADGGTLKQRIADGLIEPGDLPVPDRVGLIKEVAACIGAVHESGALHRDVKPDNFLIRSGRRRDQSPIPGLGNDERLLIADLGLAKSVVAASGVSIAAGSPGYMAPEQIQPDGRIDQRVDIFALGVMAFEILAGDRPFALSKPHAMAMLKTIDDIPLVSAASDLVPPVFDPILRKAMDPVVDGRYSDVASFVADLDNALIAVTDEPPTTRLIQPIDRVRVDPAPAPTSAPAPELAGSRSKAALIAGGVVALIAVIALVAFLAGRSGDENERADDAAVQAQAGGSVVSAERPILAGGEVSLPGPASYNFDRSDASVSVFEIDQFNLEDVIDGLIEQLTSLGFVIDERTCCSELEEVRITAERGEAGSDNSTLVSIVEGFGSPERYRFTWLAS